MLENSTTKFCMSACIFMIILSLSMNVVAIMNIFPTAAPSPVINQSMENVTKIAGGDIFTIIGDNIGTLLSAGILGAAGLVLAVMFATRTGSWNIVAVYLFGSIFWGSWLANLPMFSYGGYFSSAPALSAIYLLITVVMVFLFAGAAIGMLGGNE